jgi:ketosteroid isomerase-like protein
MSTVTDAEVIQAVHDGWFAANVNLQGDSIAEFFAEGDNYHQFNLNGFTYRGAADKVKLWEGLKRVGVNITEIKDVGAPELHIVGDVAWLAGDATARLMMPTPSGTLEESGDTPVRYTEIYRKDDGAGNEVWTIWHMHVSAAAPDGALKYGDQ